MPDITQLIFKSSIWLFVGLLLYYALSLAKVFLLTDIQPKLIYENPAFKLNIKNLWKQFILSIKHSILHKSTFGYLRFLFLILESAYRPMFSINLVWFPNKSLPLPAISE